MLTQVQIWTTLVRINKSIVKNRNYMIQTILYKKHIPATRRSIIIPDWEKILVFPAVSFVEFITQLAIYNNKNKYRRPSTVDLYCWMLFLVFPFTDIYSTPVPIINFINYSHKFCSVLLQVSIVLYFSSDQSQNHFT